MTDCKCDGHSDSSGFVSGLTVGLVLGAAGAHFLTSTEAGRKLLDDLKDKAGEALESVKDNPALQDKLSELQKTMDQARATINTAAERVADATEPSTSTSSKKNFFQRMGASLGKWG